MPVSGYHTANCKNYEDGRTCLLDEPGKLLKETRESKNITLEQIDKDLKIKPRYIEAIEAGNFEIFPSMPMARGFIKNYASYLGLNPAEVLELRDKNSSDNAKRWGSRDKGITFQNLSIVRPRSAFNIDTLITLLIITALLGSAAFFVYTQYLEPNQAQILGLNAPPVAPIQQPVKSSAAAVVLPTPTP
ncbi:MAG TPA: helix-turn-helix domain-containing protein, partial [Anaerolineae bacterium]|nr:helix-turn-helix domain-containing protein [Anaerolineae bacterium]